MHSDRQHRPSIVLIVSLALLALLLLARPAHPGWAVDPVEIHATSALCPLVAVADDSHRGAIVVWQENTATGGFLRARHLLASGDLDPAWIAPAEVSTFEKPRHALGAVSDGAGGAYVWWMESSSLWLTRVTSAGTVAAGWPARGRGLGTLPSVDSRPLAMSDRSGGLYIGWLNFAVFTQPATASIRVLHLGPSGAAAAGWPGSGRVYGYGATLNPTVVSFGMDVGADGGLWLAWQTLGYFSLGVFEPGDIRVLRTTPSGAPVPGWTTTGVALGTYPAFLNFAPGWLPFAEAAQIAVATDGGDGAFVLSAIGEADASSLVFHQSLRHVDASGASFSGWAPDGVDLGDLFATGLPDPGSGASLRLLADGRGNVYAGTPSFPLHTEPQFAFARFDGAGQALPYNLGAAQQGIEYAARGDGGMFVASFKPSGAYGPYESDAFVGVSQTGGESFFESSRSFLATRYGDIGLSATGDGGAIFAWSQLIDRQGVYAIRLNPAGVVTGVHPTVGAPSLRLRFVRGEGVLALPSLPGSGRVALVLHDVAGRVVSSMQTDDTPSADLTFPGTRDLAGGVYFARASAGGKELRARVVVVR